MPNFKDNAFCSNWSPLFFDYIITMMLIWIFLVSHNLELNNMCLFRGSIFLWRYVFLTARLRWRGPRLALSNKRAPSQFCAHFQNISWIFSAWNYILFFQKSACTVVSRQNIYGDLKKFSEKCWNFIHQFDWKLHYFERKNERYFALTLGKFWVRSRSRSSLSFWAPLALALRQNERPLTKALRIGKHIPLW